MPVIHHVILTFSLQIMQQNSKAMDTAIYAISSPTSFCMWASVSVLKCTSLPSNSACKTPNYFDLSACRWSRKRQNNLKGLTLFFTNLFLYESSILSFQASNIFFKTSLLRHDNSFFTNPLRKEIMTRWRGKLKKENKKKLLRWEYYLFLKIGAIFIT